MKSNRVVIAAVAMVGALGHMASAAPTGAPIVIEAYEGDRPADAGALLDPVYAELGRRGYQAGDALAGAVRTQISQDAGALTPGQVVEVQRAVDEGYQHFIEGDYEPALASVQRALTRFAAAPGQAREDALRDLQFKALVIAARSSEVVQHGEDAFRFMAEAIRTFPERRISGAEFDPLVSALYRRVRDELARQGTGTLDVKVDDVGAMIFVDERFVGTGSARLEHLFPGRYRVYAAKGPQMGRVREIDVAPGGAAVVTVPWQIDGVVRTHAGFVGLDLPRNAGVDADLAAAVRVARVLGSSRVVVLSIRRLNGHRAVVGYSISTESQTRLFGAIQAEPIAPAPDTLAKLGALLGGDKSAAGAGIITEEPIVVTPGAAVAARPLGRKRIAAIGVGVAALGALGVAIGFELSSRTTYAASKLEGDDAKQDALYTSANRKYQIAQGLAIGAAACAAGATILWVLGGHRDTERPTLGLAPTRGGGSLVLSGSF